MKTQEQPLIFFLFFSSRGNVIFLFVIVLNSSCPSTLQKRSPFNSSNSGKIQIKEKKQIRKDSSGLSKTLFQQYGDNLPPLSCSPQTSQELTINTSLRTANRNRIHTMHILINSCPFYKLFAYMNLSSLVTVHLIVGDLRYITVLWCSNHHHHARGHISLHRRDQQHKAA